MKISSLRTLTAILFILLTIVGVIVKTGWGTLSSFGYDVIAEICPLGSIEAMIASHTIIPRALIGFVVFAIIVFFLGRFFCGWLCPIPLIRRIFGRDNEKPYSDDELTKQKTQAKTLQLDAPVAADCIPVKAEVGTIEKKDPHVKGHHKEDPALAKAKTWETSTPYIVLLGALVSTAIFSFPVFCLICPVGLTFALVISVWHLLAYNDPSLTILLFLVLLALEIFVLRKWCHSFCPLGAVMTLLARLNYTFRPKVNKETCLKSSGIHCKKCLNACTEDIHIGDATSGAFSRCLKCHKCADACPVHAISFPFLGAAKAPKKAVHMMRVEPAVVAAPQRKEFKEVAKIYDDKTARQQASRCISCGDCVDACPLNNPIPQWLEATANGDFKKAAEMIFVPGSLPEVCSRVCPQERLCEKGCSMNERGGAVPVGALEKFIAAKALKRGLSTNHRRKGIRIAVIGAGPGGLSCADVLAKDGYKVTVYDANSMIGGLMTYGIPSFKLDKKLMSSRRKYFKKLGVTFKLNTAVGKDVSMEELLKSYRAIYVSTGANAPVELEIPGADSPQVLKAMDFLRNIAEQELANPKVKPTDERVSGKKVVVLGGGDTAMDCLRSSVRLGAASATCVIRKPESGIRAAAKEVQFAKNGGSKFLCESTVSELVFSGDKLTGLVLNTPSGKQQIEADLVIVAFGFRPEKKLWLDGLGVDFDEAGRIVNNKSEFPTQSSNEKIFAGGDATRGANLVVNAVKDGRIAGYSIMAYLKKGKQSKKK